jgi:hypothetical protein
MERFVNQFLDGYVGDNVDCRLVETSIAFWYNLKGKSGVGFYSIRISKKNGGYTVFRNENLCRMVGGIFGMSEKDAGDLISKWFQVTFNIVKFSDLSQFMDKKG